jgi:predicted transcriptional regulator
MSNHPFQLKNISKNSRSMSHHFSPLKNNSNNSRKSIYAMSHFFIEKQFQKFKSITRHLMPRHLSLPKNNYKIKKISSFHITFLH